VLSADIRHVVHRGRFMKACAHIERRGVPIDVERLAALRSHWDALKLAIVAGLPSDFAVTIDGIRYPIFNGTSFDEAVFTAWLVSKGMAWPTLPNGEPELKDQTFRDMGNVYPEVNLIREVRASLSELKLASLVVGHDGRNRILCSAFGAKSGRCTPSNSKGIFGPATWIRYLIQPEPGMGDAYIDWSAQEFGIAARLSGDRNMIDAYQSGDPYTYFAQLAGAIPPGGSAASHPTERKVFKVVCLAVQYGQSAWGLARRLGGTYLEASLLLATHHRIFKTFWAWSDSAVLAARAHGSISTVFGWPLHLPPVPDQDARVLRKQARSTRNFPMQANGAEMLRLATCLATERGLPVCATIHDALLVEAPIDQLDGVIAATQACMAEASDIVLDGFILRSEPSIIARYPDRFMDPRGQDMWERVGDILQSLERA
jgi:hypothetical protein